MRVRDVVTFDSRFGVLLLLLLPPPPLVVSNVPQGPDVTTALVRALAAAAERRESGDLWTAGLGDADVEVDGLALALDEHEATGDDDVDPAPAQSLAFLRGRYL